MNRFQIKMSMLATLILTALALSGCFDASSNSNQSPSNKSSWTTNPFTPNPTATPLSPPTPIPTPTPVPKPSELDARKLIENQIKTQSDGCIKLLSFEKTNGVDRVKDGTKMYELQYSAEIEFLKGCNWHSTSFKARERRPQPQYGFEIPIADLLEYPWQRAEKGERIRLDRKLMYEMTEKGWRLTK